MCLICCLLTIPRVFYNANQDHLEHLSWALIWFETISHLNVKGLALVLGHMEGILPTNIWYFSQGAPHKFVRAWELVEEKFKR